MSDNRTEKPTPKRRKQARDEGQVARSADLNGAIGLLAGLAVLMLTGPKLWAACSEMMTEALSSIADPSVVSRSGLGPLIASGAASVAIAAAPVAAACLLTGVAANVGQIGFKISRKALRPKPSRLNPITGAKNIFGPNALVEGGKSLLKVGLVGGLVAIVVFPRLQDLAGLVGLPPEALGSELVRHVRSIAIWASAAYLAIGLVDLIYQRHRHEKQLKMSKDEVKREAKDSDLPPEVRGALRRRQREQARARMMADVPTADVVVTNPTHYAVALRYDGTTPAPQVVAKGKDLLAKRIREIAEEHGVPVLSDPPLARSLHKAVEVGGEIPESLYQAVAQVLAFVYRQARRRSAA
jgi:flagellar biosynthetic protein FlhB